MTEPVAETYWPRRFARPLLAAFNVQPKARISGS